jgi:hypothetical protein
MKLFPVHDRPSNADHACKHSFNRFFSSSVNFFCFLGCALKYPPSYRLAKYGGSRPLCHFYFECISASREKNGQSRHDLHSCSSLTLSIRGEARSHFGGRDKGNSYALHHIQNLDFEVCFSPQCTLRSFYHDKKGLPNFVDKLMKILFL